MASTRPPSDEWLASTEPTVLEGADDAQAGSEGDPAGVGFCRRLRQMRPTRADLRRLAAAIETFERARGAVPLERCMRIARTPAQWRRAQRDEALMEALLILAQSGSDGDLHVALVSRWEAFVSRGPWRRWSHLEHLPEDTDPLLRALHLASRWNDGQTLTARQLRNVARSCGLRRLALEAHRERNFQG